MANTKINLPTGVIRDTSGNPSNSVTDVNVSSFTPQRIVDLTAPAVTEWTLNLDTGVFTFTTSEAIDLTAANIDLSKFSISGSISSVRLTDSVPTEIGTNKYSLSLTSAEVDSLKTATNNSLPIYLVGDADWGQDFSTIGVNKGLAFTNLLVSDFVAVPDITPPLFKSWSADLDNKTLTFIIEEADTNISPTSYIPTQLTFNHPDGNYTLTGGSVINTTVITGSSPLEYTVLTSLTTADANAIQSIINTSTAEPTLSATADWIADTAGNTIAALLSTTSTSFSRIIDRIPPTVTSWTLNLDINNNPAITFNFSENLKSLQFANRLYIEGINNRHTPLINISLNPEANTFTHPLTGTEYTSVLAATDNRAPTLSSIDNWGVDSADNIGLAFTGLVSTFTPSPDNIKPELVSWDLDLTAKTVRFVVSEDFVESSFSVTSMTINGHTLPNVSGRKIGNSYVINLSDASFTALSSSTSGSLSALTNWVTDLYTNTADAIIDRPADSFIPPADRTAPLLQTWILDLDNASAIFIFDEEMNAQVTDTSKMNIVGINGQVNLTTAAITTLSTTSRIVELTWNSNTNDAIKTALNNALPASLVTSANYAFDNAGNSASPILNSSTSVGTNAPMNTLGIGKSVLSIATQGTTSITPSPDVTVDGQVITRTGLRIRTDSNQASDSPNVSASSGSESTEIDVSQIIRRISTSKAVFVGEFSWGPENEVTPVSNIDQLVSSFGYPVGRHLRDWNTVNNFLSYGNRSLDIVRIPGQGNIATDNGNFISAKYDGLVGNSIGLLLLAGPTAFNSDLNNFVTTTNSQTTLLTGGRPLAESDLNTPNPGAVLGSGISVNDFNSQLLAAVLFNVSNSETSEITAIIDGVMVPSNVIIRNTDSSVYILSSDLVALGITFTEVSESRFTVSTAVTRNASIVPSQINPVNIFDTAPDIDEMHIIIYDADGRITNNPGTILEAFEYLSFTPGALNEDRLDNYYKTVLQAQSKYIKAGPVNISEGMIINQTLSGASDSLYNSSTERDALLIQALSNFSDSTISDAGIFISGDKSITVQKFIHELVNTKGDAVAIFSPPESATTDAEVIEHFSTFNSHSYSIFCSTWKRQLDAFNNAFITLPIDGDVAALLAQTDASNDAWWSPAGYNRGLISSVDKLIFNPTGAERDNLYTNRINPIITSAGTGTLLYGDKTSLSKPSAFDRINVRRLFNVLKKSISEAARYQLFEFNDEFTRLNFRTIVEQYLNIIKTGRGITDFKVIVSDNPQVIDSNQFVADIYVKPNRSINFVRLNFVAVRSGVTFNEIIDA